MSDANTRTGLHFMLSCVAGTDIDSCCLSPSHNKGLSVVTSGNNSQRPLFFQLYFLQMINYQEKLTVRGKKLQLAKKMF